MPPKRRAFTLTTKVQVIEWHRSNGSNQSKTEKEWGIDRKQIRLWDRDYDKIKHMSKTAGRIRKVYLGMRPKSEQMDQMVYEWFDGERDEGRAVSNLQLQSKAREVSAQLKVRDFKASSGWVTGWKKRYHVSMRRSTNEAQKVPGDFKDKITGFCNQIMLLKKVIDYSLFNMVNMDQTMVGFDTMPRYTNNQIGDESVRIATTGVHKKGATVALGLSFLAQ